MGLKKIFGGGAAEASRSGHRSAPQGPRLPRHSSGWVALQQFLKTNSGQRILDIGPTSPVNINFLTDLGHSVYMADLVEEANASQYVVAAALDETQDRQQYDIPRFVADNLGFAGREFEVVLLWDTLDYLPEAFVPAVVARLHQVLQPDGRLLAFFHTGDQGSDTSFHRYHLTAGESVEAQRGTQHRIHTTYSSRAIEKLFSEFHATRSFLARDKMRELLAER